MANSMNPKKFSGPGLHSRFQAELGNENDTGLVGRAAVPAITGGQGRPPTFLQARAQGFHPQLQKIAKQV
jgi:hypothetical protein